MEDLATNFSDTYIINPLKFSVVTHSYYSVTQNTALWWCEVTAVYGQWLRTTPFLCCGQNGVT